jgi:predicted nucleotidyltransferase
VGDAGDEGSGFEELLDAVAAWAAGDPRIAAVALVGSVARGTARPDSDLDLVVLSEAAHSLLQDPTWLDRFGRPSRHVLESWGEVTALRVWYAEGPEVEFGLTTPRWAARPMDPGTRQVVEGGLRVVFDREGLLRGLSR